MKDIITLISDQPFHSPNFTMTLKAQWLETAMAHSHARGASIKCKCTTKPTADLFFTSIENTTYIKWEELRWIEKKFFLTKSFFIMQNCWDLIVDMGIDAQEAKSRVNFHAVLLEVLNEYHISGPVSGERNGRDVAYCALGFCAEEMVKC